MAINLPQLIPNVELVVLRLITISSPFSRSINDELHPEEDIGIVLIALKFEYLGLFCLTDKFILQELSALNNLKYALLA